MAKKRKRQEERKEEREYKPPEFDRKEFVRTEVGVSKGTIIAAILAIPLALAAVFTMPVGGAGGGFLIGLLGIAAIWFLLPGMNIDVKSFKPVNWVGIFSTYFLLFLAIWVVLCNPPFNDFAAPEIRHVQVGWTDASGNTTWVNVTSTTGSYGAKVPSGVNITIRAQISDNVGLLGRSVRIARGGGEPIQMTQTGNDAIWEQAFPNAAQLEYFTISADDINGHSSQFRFDILP